MASYLDSIASYQRDDWFFIGLMVVLSILALYGAFLELGPRGRRSFHNWDI